MRGQWRSLSLSSPGFESTTSLSLSCLFGQMRTIGVRLHCAVTWISEHIFTIPRAVPGMQEAQLLLTGAGGVGEEKDQHKDVFSD